MEMVDSPGQPIMNNTPGIVKALISVPGRYSFAISNANRGLKLIYHKTNIV